MLQFRDFRLGTYSWMAKRIYSGMLFDCRVKWIPFSFVCLERTQMLPLRGFAGSLNPSLYPNEIDDESFKHGFRVTLEDWTKQGSNYRQCCLIRQRFVQCFVFHQMCTPHSYAFVSVMCKCLIKTYTNELASPELLKTCLSPCNLMLPTILFGKHIPKIVVIKLFAAVISPQNAEFTKTGQMHGKIPGHALIFFCLWIPRIGRAQATSVPLW